jgi:molybdopterin-guanine dinucleotide biosynthesis protein A
MADPGPGEDAVAPLRACLLSGGQSRRMGRDKALLPHPGGGTWLEASLRLLAGLGVPLTLLTRHRNHLEAATTLAAALEVTLEAVEEGGPWEGPLLALQRLMERHPGQRLLLCPVDMPWLEPATLQALVAAAALRPERIHAAHDGVRLQPLLGIYPADPPHRAALAAFTASGGRSLQRWLQDVGFTAVPLPASALRNANHPHDLTTPRPPAAAPG